MQALAKSLLEFLSELEQKLLLGTVIEVQIRIGSRTKTFHLVKAHDGLRPLHDYRSEKYESGKLEKPFGIVGATLLHGGIRKGDQITSAIQLDCLPDGSVIEQHLADRVSPICIR